MGTGSSGTHLSQKMRYFKHKTMLKWVPECLSPAFLKSAKQRQAKIPATKEQPIKVVYDGQVVGDFSADILVHNQVILELKALRELHPAHEAQLNNYLKATGMEVGLLINFGGKLDVRRKINDLPPLQP